MTQYGTSIRTYAIFLLQIWTLHGSCRSADDARSIKIGEGIYRAKTAEDISELEGWIYAFSFPILVRTNAPFPIKIGKTIADVDGRVAQQCKGSASFDNPVILGRWQVNRVGPTELAAHNVLKARGKWREKAPGVEWFDTTIAEVQSILEFVASA